MAVDLSLIPQNRVAELVSKLSSIDSSISTINTNVSTNDSNAVHKTGNETIAGTKTFSNTPIFTADTYVQKSGNFGALHIKNTNYDYLTNPSAAQYQYIVWKDKNNKDMSYVQQHINTDGTVSFYHVGSNYKTDGTRVNCALGAHVNRAGSIWTSAPTPATSDNSTKIATTAYVRNQNYVPQSSLTESKVVITTYQSGFAWYRVWSDGWCEQGDCVYTDVNGWQNATCTLLLPMKDTNYHVSITSSWGGNGDGASYYYANNYKTTTSFQTNVTNYSPSYGYSTWKASGYKA